MLKRTSENNSNPIEFSMQGFSDSPKLKFHLFITFLLIYLTIVISNLTIVASIISCTHLHTPMYIFLCNLSVIDIFYTSTILPKLLDMLFTQCKTISFAGCFIQMYFFIAFACSEFLLLAVMAYDRYVAICNPLHYSLLMSPKTCAYLILGNWIGSLLDPIPHTILISKLSFCSSHHINHFFCDVSPLLKLSCNDTSSVEMWTFILGGVIGMSCFTLTLASYVFIISSILNIQSETGRRKAFSTCASHITCVFTFYGTMTCLYMRPRAMYSPGQDKFFALLYVILIPIANPPIYTLKNTDFKKVFKQIKLY
ncbi:olfactory receptor 5AR1-like [Pelobates fuscus]|uniref:olfactory receptor 5AR1-like n=1 Tax=Pelobates fuscus TaxID=191477 RepID=UPI002FE4C04B